MSTFDGDGGLNVSQAYARVSAYFEELPTPAYLWRREGAELVLRRFNKAATRRFGENVKALLGSLARELCADQPDIVQALNTCLETQVASSRETEFDSRELGRRRLKITYVPVAPDAVVAHAEDISDLIEAHEREERAAANLAEYFQRFPTPAYLWQEIDGEIVLQGANRAGVEQTGGHVKDFVGITAREMYVERQDILHDLRRAVAGETFSREFTYQMLMSKEQEDLVVTYVHIPPDTVVVHTREVTEQRRMEEALRDREAEMATVMKGNPDGICLIVNGRIRRCNRSLAAMMGRDEEELIGSVLHDLMIPEDRERAQAQGRAILDGQPAAPSEYTLVRGDGSLIPVEIYGAAFDFRGEPALSCTLRDIGRRKESERELAEGRDALRALTQHLEHVREQERLQVARDLHDELGSVLTALKIDCSQVLSSGSSPADADLLDGMSDLLDQAIEVGRRVTARLRPGILDDLGLAAAAELLGSDLSKRTGIRCDVVLPVVEPVLPEPVATAMFRILQEALTNVIRHAEAESVRITLGESDQSVSLLVADDGRGFDVDAPVHSGFGLLGMRERVRGFAGTLDVTSSKGEGTQVSVVLPF